ncbi:hypothetical protein ALT785_460005 [Alteromonas infernus]
MCNFHLFPEAAVTQRLDVTELSVGVNSTEAKEPPAKSDVKATIAIAVVRNFIA